MKSKKTKMIFIIEDLFDVLELSVKKIYIEDIRISSMLKAVDE